MKNFKKVSVLIATILTTVVLYGCGAKDPKVVANEYLSKIQNGNMNVQELVNGSSEEAEEKLQSQSFSEETKSKLIDKIKAMTYTIDGETIDAENAKVNVTINGPDLSMVFVKVMEESLDKSAIGTAKISEATNIYFDRLFDKYLDQVTYSQRGGEISLVKVNGEWKIEENGPLQSLIFGMGKTTLCDGSDPTR